MTSRGIVVVALVTTVLGACAHDGTSVNVANKEVFVSGVRMRATTLPAPTSRQVTVQVELYNPTNVTHTLGWAACGATIMLYKGDKLVYDGRTRSACEQQPGTTELIQSEVDRHTRTVPIPGKEFVPAGEYRAVVAFAGMLDGELIDIRLGAGTITLGN